MPNPTNDPQNTLRTLLAELITSRRESLRVFGQTLAAVVEPGRKPYSKTYIIRLRDGHDNIPPDIERALWTLAAIHDGVSNIQASARPAQILTIHDLPANVVNLARPRACALPGCQIVFIPASPAQRYCSPECRQANRRRHQHQDNNHGH